nr:putative transporter c36.02c [Quercus suber]
MDASEKPEDGSLTPKHDDSDVENDAGSPDASSSPPNLQDEKEAFKVDFEKGDPSNPKNWSAWYKAWITLQLGMLAMSGSLNSSIISPAAQDLSSYLNISMEAVVLTVALYVLGFAVGPSLWAPISETYGRKVSMLPAVFTMGLFAIGTANSKNAASVFITRFFGGVFGSAPISNVSAALGDIYAPAARGTAVTFYAVAVTGGPTLGPLIGAALTVNPHLGWRWTEYIAAIFAFTMFALTLVCLPELYAPVLLKRKARRMRKETGDERYWHPHEAVQINLQNVFTKHLSRPLVMFFTEPMVTLIALYASFVYALLYMTLEVFPIVYSEERGYSLVISTLPFLGLFIGVVCAVFVNLANQPRYTRLVAANKGRAVPEARLQPMIIGGVLFAIGLFWYVGLTSPVFLPAHYTYTNQEVLFRFGWTAAPRFHWSIPTVATIFIGGGFNIIFQQCLNYLVDVYGLYAASAVSANTVLRSLLACGLPLASRPMFLNLGVGPAASILGGVACLALPVPLLFSKYSLRLRRKSKFAPVVED